MINKLLILIKKEWQEMVGNKMVLVGIVVLPLMFLGFSLFLLYRFGKVSDLTSQKLLINFPLIYFLLFPIIIPLAIAVYAIMGEKEQGTLEPLLATPIREIELFLAKALASVIPALLITWTVFGIFLLSAYQLTSKDLAGLFLSPSWVASIFLLSPLVSVFSVTATMAISSRLNDSRAAYQLSTFVMLPILIPIFIYLVNQTLISLQMILLESLVIAILDGIMFFVSVKVFKREEILTRWK